MKRFFTTFILLASIALLLGQSRQGLNYGTAANDGTGDTLRDAMIKLDTNIFNLWSQAFTNLPNTKLENDGGTVSNLKVNGLTADRVPLIDSNNALTNSAITSAELAYLSGISSNIQAAITSLDQYKLTASGGTATNLSLSGPTVDRALLINSSGVITNSAVTSTELGYISGLTGNAQTQINQIPREFPNLGGVDPSGATTNSVWVNVDDGEGGYNLRSFHAGAVDVKWFGAVGDGVTDDFAAFELWADYLKTSYLVVNGVTNRYQGFIPRGTYYVSESLDWTRLTGLTSSRNDGLTIYGSGIKDTVIMGGDDGYPVIDAMGMNYLDLQGFSITSADGSSPSCGLLVGRRDDTENGGNNYFKNLYISGDFTVSQFYGIASESTKWEHCTFINAGNPNANTTFIAANSVTNHSGTNISSRYQSITTAGAGVRNSVITYDTCSFQNNDSLTNNRVVRLETPYGHNFINCYMYAAFTNDWQPIIETYGRAGGNSFIGLRQEYTSATKLTGLKILSAGAENDWFNNSFIGCSMAPIYGEDNMRLTSINMLAHAWYAAETNINVFDVWKLYDSRIDQPRNYYYSGAGTKQIVDGIYQVRQNSANNMFNGIKGEQVSMATDGSEWQDTIEYRHKSSIFIDSTEQDQAAITLRNVNASTNAAIRIIPAGVAGPNPVTTQWQVQLDASGVRVKNSGDASQKFRLNTVGSHIWEDGAGVTNYVVSAASNLLLGNGNAVFGPYANGVSGFGGAPANHVAIADSANASVAGFFAITDTGGQGRRIFFTVDDGNDKAVIGATVASGIIPLIVEIASSEQVRFDTTGMRVAAGKKVTLGASGPTINFGSGSPEGVITANVGSTYHRTDGGAGTSFYVKESGTGNTGWAAK